MKILFLVFFFVGSFGFSQSLRHADEALVIRTDYGDMAIALFPDLAPKHVEQMLILASGGVFDNAMVFRLEPGFVAQIANYDRRQPPLTAEQKALVHKIPAEFSDVHHRRGIISMARFDDPNSAETSFSMLLGDAPHLDGKYTVLGEIIRGIEVLKEIEKLPPNTVRIKKVEVVKESALDGASIKAAGPAPIGLQYYFLTVVALGAVVFFGINAWQWWKS